MTGALSDAVREWCAEMGRDSLLIQGGGGNVSWKDGELLWVKASGCCLADAMARDIFLPVDLPQLICALSRGDFSPSPRVHGDCGLKPSIETLLHALMPHRLVLHLHPVEVLAVLVRKDCRDLLEDRLLGSAPFILVDYHKPGEALVRAVAGALAREPRARVLFLKNHGVVIGGEDVDEVRCLLQGVIAALAAEPRRIPALAPSGAAVPEGYRTVGGPEIQSLAHPALYQRVRSAWELYPDHLVFLGGRPHCFDWPEQAREELEREPSIGLFFLKGEGVFAAADFGAARTAQLQCYRDVLVRQPAHAQLDLLPPHEVAALLDWDAEKHRQQMAQGGGAMWRQRP